MQPDDRIEIRAGGEALAQCALWWNATPRLNGKRVGYIGDYSRSDARAAQKLLAAARKRLAAAGCDVAVGPVDADTWHRYRFVTDRGTQPPFLLEPQNPREYPCDFEHAGFAGLAHYVSSEQTAMQYADPRAGRAAQRLAEAGVRIRNFEPQRFDEELDAVYSVACKAFAGALLFSPIGFREFRSLYEPLRSRIDPGFIRIAEHEGRTVGFAFGIPDGDTVVGKTQAVLPELRYAGLGAVMLDDVRRTAHERGMRRIVHALIREDNIALNGSRRTAKPIRRYTLYAGAVQ